MHRLLAAFFLLISVVSCAPHHQVGYEPEYAEDGFTRQKIAIIPVFDDSNPNLEWNVSYELTQEIRDKIKRDNHFFLLDEDQTFRKVLRTRHMSLDEMVDLIWPVFGRADYVILLELIQHDVLAYERESHPEICTREDFCCNNTLQQKIRISVLNVQWRPKKLILEEMITLSSTIPKECEFWDYRSFGLGSVYYPETPIAKAHQHLAERVAEYIETVIWSLK